MKRLTLWILPFLLLGLIIGCGKLPDETLLKNGKEMEASEDFSGAVAKYEKLVDLYPNSELSPEALYRSGLIEANILQNVKKATFQFQRVVDEYGDSTYAPQAQFMIGFVFANSMPDTAKAREAYKTFLENYPDHELVPSVEWELKYLGKDINDIPELMSSSDTEGGN